MTFGAPKNWAPWAIFTKWGLAMDGIVPTRHEMKNSAQHATAAWAQKSRTRSEARGPVTAAGAYLWKPCDGRLNQRRVEGARHSLADILPPLYRRRMRTDNFSPAAAAKRLSLAFTQTNYSVDMTLCLDTSAFGRNINAL